MPSPLPRRVMYHAEERVSDAMRAGREMDALVAEKVMGATWSESDRVARAACTMRGMLGTPKQTLRLSDRVLCWRSVSGAILAPDDGPSDNLPHYSTDIVAAWLVLDKLAGPGFRVDLRASGAGTFDVSWWVMDDEEGWIINDLVELSTPPAGEGA
jgi:hypothetical protein